MSDGCRKAAINTVLVFLGVCLCGCARTYRVNVQSFTSAPEPVKRKYVLAPADENVNPSDLEYQEYARQVEYILGQNGYIETGPDQANLAIFLGYGISGPQSNIEIYSRPAWGHIGYHHPHSYYRSGFGFGYQTEIREYTTYTKHLTLTAWDYETYKKNKGERQYWKVTAVSTGSSANLRQTFSALALAAGQYLGQNTGPDDVTIMVSEEDEPLQTLRKTAGHPPVE